MNSCKACNPVLVNTIARVHSKTPSCEFEVSLQLHDHHPSTENIYPVVRPSSHASVHSPIYPSVRPSMGVFRPIGFPGSLTTRIRFRHRHHHRHHHHHHHRHRHRRRRRRRHHHHHHHHRHRHRPHHHY